MSTVGFGDISAVTYFGRTFMMLFISIGLVCCFYSNLFIGDFSMPLFPVVDMTCFLFETFFASGCLIHCT